MVMLLGGYTLDMGEDAPGKARGISAYDFSPRSGEVSFRGVCPAVNPSYLWTDPERRLVYAIRECPNEAKPGVAVFRVNRGRKHSIAFEPVHDHVIHADHPCHLTKIKDTLVVSSYTSGTLHVLRLREDGGIDQELQRLELRGTESNPRAHCSVYDPERERVYVCDLGCDCLRMFDRLSDGTLRENAEGHIHFTPGTGPRHAILHHGGGHLLVNSEFRGRISLIDIHGDFPKKVADVPFLPERAIEDASGAAIRTDRTGRNLYTSERNFSLISALRVDTKNHHLQVRDTVPSGGLRPRDIDVSPDGKWLISANLKDHTLGIFRVGAGGALTLNQVINKVPSPTCINWLPGL